MIEAVHLTKKYGPHTAVEDLTFTIREGQVYGFLGPNGAGKTTTMNMITGYLAPTAGEVRIDGTDLRTDPVPARRRIGYLPEVPPLYPDLTVREYLLFAAELKGVPGRRRREEADKVMKELSLMEMKDRLIRALSKGYRQRTGIAQALLGDPKTVILDEPTAGLDPRQITEIRSLIRRLGKDHAVLLSSHILQEISETCDTVLILSEGKKAAEGSPETLAGEQSKTTVTVLTAGEEAVIRAALAGIAGAPELRISAEGGRKRLVITKNGNEDPGAGITAALVGNGLPVYEITSDRRSLEELFLSLTKEGR
ncbi:MAG: ABC transporter ATP-binding protein [Lachnospiraceae bacterium]|nr:ABC transporter ATP-binding protein [Lachnospiraceae bacterium]